MVITNVVLGNAGDAAILEGIVACLTGLGVITGARDVTVLDEDAERSRARFPELTVLQQPGFLPRDRSRVRRAVQPLRSTLTGLVARRKPALAARLDRSEADAWAAVARADLLVSTGGTYLVEAYRIWHRLLHLWTLSQWQPPLVLWTQSLGPFRRRTSRILASAVLRRCALVMVRDQPSRMHIEELGLRDAPRLETLLDVAFALPAPERTVAEGCPTAAISVREWTLTTDGLVRTSGGYESGMTAAATWLAEHGYHVRALSTCQGLPEYPVDDSQLAERLFADSPVMVDSAWRRPDELLQVLARVDVVVATRMHFAILALLAGCQVVAVAYEFKTRELFTELGLSDFVRPIEEVTPEWITDRLEVLRSDSRLGRLSEETRRRAVDRATPDLLSGLLGG